MSEIILKKLEEKLEGTLFVVKRDLSSLRTGRAKSSLVENIKVEAYGDLMEIRELAGISSPDSTLIVITPWDKSLTAAIATGIRKSELNISPIVDGESIKIAIPPLTEERRLEMVKQVHQKLESGKVMVRNIRGEIKEDIEKQKGEAGISEDNIEYWLEQMQKTVEKYIENIEVMGKEKEKELMTL